MRCQLCRIGVEDFVTRMLYYVCIATENGKAKVQLPNEKKIQNMCPVEKEEVK